MTAAEIHRGRCDLLAAAWRWWADVLTPLPDPSWSRPTRLEGWDVHALVAHHAMFVRALPVLASAPVDPPATVPTARDMLRGFNAPGGPAHTLASGIADAARSQAAAQPAAELAERLAVDAPAAVMSAREAGPIVVDYFGNGRFPLTEVLSIGILEAVVHGLDLARAVDAPPDLPAGPVTHAVALLADLADPIAFVEAATGRGSAPALPVLR